MLADSYVKKLYKVGKETCYRKGVLAIIYIKPVKKNIYARVN